MVVQLKIHTVIDPNSRIVGSGPNENINRSITDATSVLIPDSRGNVITMANENIMMAQIKHDMCELSSGTVLSNG